MLPPLAGAGGEAGQVAQAIAESGELVHQVPLVAAPPPASQAAQGCRTEVGRERHPASGGALAHELPLLVADAEGEAVGALGAVTAHRRDVGLTSGLSRAPEGARDGLRVGGRGEAAFDNALLAHFRNTATSWKKRTGRVAAKPDN